MSFSGFPATIYDRRQESSVVKWLVHDLVSRAVGLIASSNAADEEYEIGTVFGMQTIGAVAAAVAGGANVTNDTVSAPTAGANCAVGSWRIEGFTAGATGYFMVFNPSGGLDGIGKVGTAYSGGIGFTITDGATHLAVGDYWTVAVAAGNGKYYPLNLAATDGTQNAAAVLSARAFVPENVDSNGTFIIREAVVLSDPLIWPAGITGNQITAALAQLTANRIYNVPSV